MKTKKPKIPPIKTKQKTAISSYPSNHPVLHEIIPNVKNEITDNPPANPSSPSVILTALLLATNINKINKPYNQLISIFKFRVLIQTNGSLPPFINR